VGQFFFAHSKACNPVAVSVKAADAGGASISTQLLTTTSTQTPQHPVHGETTMCYEFCHVQHDLYPTYTSLDQTHPRWFHTTAELDTSNASPAFQW
jgi:hypothetical protein